MKGQVDAELYERAGDAELYERAGGRRVASKVRWTQLYERSGGRRYMLGLRTHLQPAVPQLLSQPT